MHTFTWDPPQGLSLPRSKREKGVLHAFLRFPPLPPRISSHQPSGFCGEVRRRGRLCGKIQSRASSFLPSTSPFFWVGRRKGTRKSLSILGIPLEEGSDCCCCGVLVFGVARNKPNTNPTQQQQPMSDSSLANRGVCASSNRTHPLFCWNRRIQPERESASENIRGGEEGMNENEPKHETRTQDSQWGEPSPRKRTGEKNGSDWGAGHRAQAPVQTRLRVERSHTAYRNESRRPKKQFIFPPFQKKRGASCTKEGVTC